MSWRDVLTAEPAPQYSQYPHNYQGLVPEPISEDIGEQNRPVNLLHGQARQAADWEALYTVLDAAQAAYDDGDVTREEVGALAGYVADRSRQVPEHAEDGHLSELLARQPVVRVRSRLLSEVVVWMADAAELPDDTSEVVYRETELRHIVGRSKAEVRAIHEVKRILDGELLES